MDKGQKEKILEYRTWKNSLGSQADFEQWMKENHFSVDMGEADLKKYLRTLQEEYKGLQLPGNVDAANEGPEIQEIVVSDHQVNKVVDKFYSDVKITVRNKGNSKTCGPFVIPRGIIGGITKVENKADSSCTFTCADGSVAKLDLTAKSNAGQNKVKTSVNVGLSVSGTAVKASVTGVSGGLNGLSLQLTGLNVSADALFYTASIWEQSSKFLTGGVGGGENNVNSASGGNDSSG